MKKETNKRKNILSVSAVMTVLVAAMLTACSSGQAAATPANEEAVKAEVTEEAPAVEQAEEAATPEPTAEPTPEPEESQYPGINMESTLPGIEWLDTFDGVIEESKFIIFNDETNKKIIVENGKEAEISSTDTFTIYYPLDKEIVVDSLEDNSLFCNISIGGRYSVYFNLSHRYKEGDKVEVSQVIWVDGEEMELKATLIIKND